MNQMYGFQEEVKVKYSSEMANLFTEVYNWLPLAHCINKKILVSILFSNFNLCCRVENRKISKNKSQTKFMALWLCESRLK